MGAGQQAIGLMQQKGVRAAFELLSEKVSAGDPEAAFALAQWRLTGDIIRRDLVEARRLFGLAAQCGLREAQGPYIALLANGAGGTGCREWRAALRSLRASADAEESERQLALIEAMDVDDQGNPRMTWKSERVSVAPQIWKLAHFLSPEECSYLCSLAMPRLQPSVVIHPATGEFIRDPVRKSSTTSFPFIDENPVIHAINRRIAAATGTSYNQGEPTQIISYDVDEEYRLHSDVIPSSDNQRDLTFLIYLNTHYEGGETYFPSSGWAYKGKLGEAVFFKNVDERGAPCPLAAHAGCKIISGRKMILSKWIRRQALDIRGPSGKPF